MKIYYFSVYKKKYNIILFFIISIIFFFQGRTTQNLTVVSQFFLNNPTIQYWQFESSYTVTSINGVTTGSGSIRFTINSPPQNGTCNIDQTNGTTMTLFHLTCLNWIDSDGIQDYTFYGISI